MRVLQDRQARADAKLCVEIDNDSHAEQVEYDQARTEYLNELGIQSSASLIAKCSTSAKRCCTRSVPDMIYATAPAGWSHPAAKQRM
jgi:hypothetical protein